LTPGNYTVQFGTQDGVYASEWWNDKDSRENANPISVTEGQTTGGVNAELAVRTTPAGRIGGTITGPSGAPLTAGTSGYVSAYDSAGEPVNGVLFDADGVFQIRGLEPGTYTVQFQPDGGGYAPEWWQDKASRQTATPVTVSSGTTTTIAPQLNPAGSITGTVTGPGGAALDPDTGGSVDVYTLAGDYVDGWYFEADGAYTVNGLAAGDYLVKFSTYSGGYLTEWWQDAASQAQATKLTVTAGQATTVNPELNPGGAITGTVTGPDGAALVPGTYGFIRAYDSTGAQVGFTSFDADPQEGGGAFRISGLTTGAYKLRVVSMSYKYRTQWWNRDLSAADADAVSVTIGLTTPGINPALQSTSSVPGVPTVSNLGSGNREAGNSRTIWWMCLPPPGVKA
jgi:hypothetical protein